jgi:hypothetical protein
MPHLTGSWIGTLTYGNSYPKASAGTKMDFKIDISTHIDKDFTGECLDLDDLGKYAGASAIKGTLTAHKIHFTKQYTVRRLAGTNGMPFIEHKKPGGLVTYTGSWNEDQHCFQGEWEIEGGTGTWEMKEGEAELMPEEEDVSIIMYYDKYDLETLYMRRRQMKKNSEGIRVSLGIMGGILLLAALSFKLAMIYESVGWIVLFLAFVCAFIWSINMLIKNIQNFKNWKISTINYINRLAENRSHTLILNRQTFTIRTPSELVMERWEKIKEVEISDDAILLSAELAQFSFIAASMKAEEYELIKRYIQSYTITI